MKHHLPKAPELAIVAVLSLILAAVAVAVGPVDTMLAVITVPLFFGFAMLGLIRSGKLPKAQRQVVSTRDETRPLR
jgi:hypothetical protein